MLKLSIMKVKLLPILFIAAFFTGCSTAYKSGQTPDDVYFSPARHDYDRDSARLEKRQDNTVYNENRTVYDNNPYEDRVIRRRINNRRYRRYDDRYNYPYGYNQYPVYSDVKTNNQSTTSQPRKTNLGVYTNPSTNTTTDNKTAQTNGSGVGNLIRKVFSGTGSSSSSDNSNTYSNKPSSSSNSSNNNSNSSSSSNSNSSKSSSTNSTNVPVRKF